MIGSKIYFLLVTLASVGSASAAVANEAGYRWLANEGRLGTDELYQRLVKGNKGPSAASPFIALPCSDGTRSNVH